MNTKISQLESNRQYQERRRRKLGITTRDDKQILAGKEFVHRSILKHKKQYDYSLVNYRGMKTKVQIVCAIHGSFTQTPSAHQYGQGCPSCGQEGRLSTRKRKTLPDFIAESNIIHNNKYDYTKTIYTNIKTKVDIVCLEHGQFTQEAKAHLRGQGCPECANKSRASFYESNGERLIVEYLQSNNIQFIRQKTFPECKYKMLLRYDFYLPNKNTLIEFDGEQHYKYFPKFHADMNTFKNMQLRDNVKNKFAHANNISLIRIRWNQTKQIPTILSYLINANKKGTSEVPFCSHQHFSN